MQKEKLLLSLTPIYALVLIGFVFTAGVTNRVITVISMEPSSNSRHTIIIDPGHGGEDGGATSCTGVLESTFNLEIGHRLNDMMHLLGLQTLMIRETDRSVYRAGETIAQKKVSDLKERVRIINETPNALLISIHQNTFPVEQYWGAQAFYPNTSGSKEMASIMQSQLQKSLMPSNNRKAKPANGIYLMEKIQCTGLLLECGFLSNRQEEAKLRDGEYQKQLCAVIASVYSQYLSDQQQQEVL